MSIQQFCLRWNNHQPNFISVFTTFLNTQSLVDVTLAAEGKHLQAHKVVLSACSVYFQTLFTANPSQHPIVILKDVKYADLRIMVDFMYYGEVNVSQEQLPQILETAKMLKIKGLTEMPESTSLTKSQSTSSADLTPGESSWESQRHSMSPSNQLSPTVKRKRLRKGSTGSGSTGAIPDPRNSEDKSYDPIGNSLDKNDTVTLMNSIPQQRRHDFNKDSDENGAIDVTLTQNCNDQQGMPVDPLTIGNQSGLQQASRSNRSGLSSRTVRHLLRQARVSKDGDSVAITRSLSEPSPPVSRPRKLAKVASHPPMTKNHQPEDIDAAEHLNVGAPSQQTSSRSEQVAIEALSSVRASHCPVVRVGPALSCNYCWNTVDDEGRILRRKTNYFCPECRTNLCLVPCFYQYHARTEPR